MATVRKVTSSIKKAAPKEEAPKTEAPAEASSADEKNIAAKPKKGCFFCESKSEPHYWDVQTLRRSMNDRGRISARARTGACAKHQRRVAREIKHARHLALLPFVVSA